ncbi:MAG: hypothetical protein HOK35_08595 [Cytophagia bacterium]|nr:hypothetical protein [Cytophagia bacterium]
MNIVRIALIKSDLYCQLCLELHMVVFENGLWENSNVDKEYPMGFFKSYDDEYLELYEYLTQDWKMKPKYAKPFLNTYKKSIGKIFYKGKKRMVGFKNSSDIFKQYIAVAGGDDQPFALVSQAYKAYVKDLRRGLHVGTSIELAIWAILVKRSDLVGSLDITLEKWIDDENYKHEYPNLFDEVFQDKHNS